MTETLVKVLNNIKKMECISPSYLQRNFDIGYNRSQKVFSELISSSFVDEKGRVNKEKVYAAINEEYVPGLKIIFLDVDGVLNCHSTKDMCGMYTGIEDKKVALLKQIVDSTNAKIILVSNWKEWWFKEPQLKSKQDELANYLDEKFKKQGLVIADKVDDYYGLNRGDAILEYLRKLKWAGLEADKYVVLDDELFDYMKTKITKNLIRTSYDKNGLEMKHVRKAVEKLC